MAQQCCKSPPTKKITHNDNGAGSDRNYGETVIFAVFAAFALKPAKTTKQFPITVLVKLSTALQIIVDDDIWKPNKDSREDLKFANTTQLRHQCTID